MKRLDLSGQRFGTLTVLNFDKIKEQQAIGYVNVIAEMWPTILRFSCGVRQKAAAA